MRDVSFGLELVSSRVGAMNYNWLLLVCADWCESIRIKGHVCTMAEDLPLISVT